MRCSDQAALITCCFYCQGPVQEPIASAPAPAVAYMKGYAINVGSDCAYTASDGTVYVPDT